MRMDKPETPLRHAVMYADPLGDTDGAVPSTKQDYENFCAGVMLYAGLLGLTDWHINFRWEDDADDRSDASVCYNYENRSATFTFGRRICAFFRESAAMMMKLALHETLHLLFAGINWVADADNLTPAQKANLLGVAEHDAIRRLENVLLGLPKAQSDDYLVHRVKGKMPRQSA